VYFFDNGVIMAEHALPKGYEPAEVEERWLRYWEENTTFTPDPASEKEPYSIVIPPPNVTGKLHMGHALNLTLQDILCRFYRQQGRNVLWVPGTDHAGIATQNVVEKALAKEGKTRDDVGREQFIERVWEWKEEYGNAILNQIRRMGASVDWTRTRFTMDEGLSRAVREVFVRLYDEGLIYKGNYIINWCPRCHTALADIEVEHKEIPGGLYEVRYPLADGSGDVVIATTRPETIPGDTAVAVHPEDERYAHLVGKELILPILNRRIPIIADSYVDREFGTACLKVTPAHDMNDFALGRTHNLPTIQVIDDKGMMTEEAGPEFVGLDRFACRKKILALLEEGGFLVGKKEYVHSVGHCYRCNTAIEPYVSKQWFVSTAPLAKVARQAVADGRTKIYPSHWDKTYFEWLDNIRDWCISRQIWWGHRIPAWTCQDCGRLIVAKEDPSVCPECQGKRLVQEDDVLDTWFSSALWPFSTLGWPDRTPELATFYPTSVLVTGFDILFFWVARMMMMGLHFMDKIPFDDVYIHALVRDAQGRKMSKSTGNVIDPLTTIDTFGTDAFRFTLTSFAAMGRDIKLAEDRIEGYRHFINKIWNAARFSLMHLDETTPKLDPAVLKGLHHAWILNRLEEIKGEVKKAIEGYQFNEYAGTMYQFVWHEFCDWYLEMIKPELYGEDEAAKQRARACLGQVLRETLVLLHPVVPFVSQEIWSHMPGTGRDNLAEEPYPAVHPDCENKDAGERMEFLQQLVVAVRNIRSELGVEPAKKVRVLIKADGEDASFILDHEQEIANLARLEEISVQARFDPPKGCATTVVKGHELFVPLEGMVDFDAELARLSKELDKLTKELDRVTKKLANPSFVDKAPADVVAKEEAKAKEFGEKREKLEGLQARLRDIIGE
jgi:valyl-tRNA synthetase